MITVIVQRKKGKDAQQVRTPAISDKRLRGENY
jgi:hypothetical protein